MMELSQIKHLLVVICAVLGVHTATSSHEVGIADGRIPDAQITASSCYDANTCTDRARLNQKKIGIAAGAWVAKVNNQDQYIQVDLLKIHEVEGVMTQGRNGVDEWVTSYEVLYSLDGLIWTTMQNEENPGSTVFNGNTDQDSVVSNDFYDIVARFIRIRPMTWSDHISMRFEVVARLKASIEDPPRALGMEGNLIPDSAITASSYYYKSPATQARLDTVARGGKKGGWSPRTVDSNQWLQVDLNGFYMITGVITQGQQDSDKWVTAFRVDYSEDGRNWKSIQDCSGNAKGFIGNTDRNSKVTSVFKTPIKGRFIRIHPISWRGSIAMRLEILGKGPMSEHNYEPLKLGMEDGRIKTSQLTSSSCYSKIRCVGRARLNQGAEGNFKGAWSARISDHYQWIQVDLLKDYELDGIVTQGKSDLDQWVNSFSLQYGSTGHPTLVDVVDDNGAVLTFQGNSDRNTPVTNLLPFPVKAQFVRILPKTWNGYISMRFELLGNGPVDGVQTLGKLGIEDGRVASSSLSASSCLDVNQCVSRSRLDQPRQGPLTGAWSAAVNDGNQWIQVDLRSAFKVSGVITQGRNSSDEWVKSFKMSYSFDGMRWIMISDCHPAPQIFKANYDVDSTVENTLNPPVTARFFRLHPVTWNNHISLRWELLGEGPLTITNASEKLGVEDYRVPDVAMTASSVYNALMAAPRARLNQIQRGGYRGSWVARYLDNDQWLQIDLRGIYRVTGIITQGQADLDQWVIAYKVAHSLNGQNFTTVLSRGSQQEKIFSGNSDRATEVTHYFSPVLTTRFIRVLPSEWHGRISMRMELLGVGPVARMFGEPEPLGIENGLIPDSSMTASSEYNSYAKAAGGRLNQARTSTLYGGWLPRTRDVNQWIQVDLLKPYRIFSVATQGRSRVNQWVKSYKISCSSDGVNFHTVQSDCTNPIVDMIFTANTDYDTVVYNDLPVPEVCRYVRLMPMTWYSYIAVRMELYGEGPVAE